MNAHFSPSVKAKLAGLAAASVGYWCLAILAGIGIGFCTAAIYMGFAIILNPPAAAAITGVIALAVSALIVFIVWLACRLISASGPETSKPAEEKQWVSQLIDGSLTDYVRDNAQQATLVALVAGAMAGASPTLRKRSMQLIGELLNNDSRDNS